MERHSRILCCLKTLGAMENQCQLSTSIPGGRKRDPREQSAWPCMQLIGKQIDRGARGLASTKTDHLPDEGQRGAIEVRRVCRAREIAPLHIEYTIVEPGATGANFATRDDHSSGHGRLAALDAGRQISHLRMRSLLQRSFGYPRRDAVALSMTVDKHCRGFADV